MIGTPTSILVRVSRRLSDEAYGSYEVAAELEVNLPADANLEESFDTLDTWLTAAVAKSMAEKKASIQKDKPVAEIRQTDGEGLGEKPTTDKLSDTEGASRTAKIVKFTLKKRPDKKFELELYPEIKGAPGKYPEVRYVAERERMWEMLSPIAEGYDFTDLPAEFDCNLTANYLIGKEFVIAQGAHKGEKSHYKDLVSVKEAA